MTECVLRVPYCDFKYVSGVGVKELGYQLENLSPQSLVADPCFADLSNNFGSGYEFVACQALCLLALGDRCEHQHWVRDGSLLSVTLEKNWLTLTAKTIAQ